MFRKRTMQVKLVKDQDLAPAANPAVPQNSPETIALEVIKETTASVAGTLVFVKVVDVLCKTALHIVTTKIK